MLLQSHEGYIAPLPALPQTWRNGRYNGLVARGNFELSVSWQAGHLILLNVLSRKGNTCTLYYPGIDKATITDSKGKNIKYQVEATSKIRFKTKEGESYTIQL